MASASEKRKQFVQRIRYVALVLFTSLIIISFVVSLAYNPFSERGRMRFPLVKINGKWFYEGVDTGFAYWYDEQKARFQQQGINLSDIDHYEDMVEGYANVLSVASYTKRLGIKPSDFFYTQLAQGLYGKAKPTFGEREYMDIFYALNIFLGDWGELQNTLSLSPVSTVLLYQDAKNLVYDVEIVYTEKTNFVARFVEKTDLEAYYQQHLTNFLDTLVVDRITFTNKNTVSNRLLAEIILSNIQDMGWEKAIASLPSDAVVVKGVTLTKDKHPRVFDAVTTFSSHNIVLPKPVFENKQYHIIRLQRLSSLEDLSPIAQQRLLKAYLGIHFDTLWMKYSNDFIQTVNSLYTSSTADWKVMVSNKPFGYVKIPKFSLVNLYLEDTENNLLPYQLQQLFQRPEVLSFLASSGPTVKQFEFGSVYFVVRKNGVSRLSRKPTPDETTEAFYYMRNAWSQDWQKMIESKSKIVYKNRKK